VRPILWIIGSLVCFSIGEAVSKYWANARYPYFSWLVVICVATYATGSLCWLPAIRERNHLSSLGSLWNAGAMVATVLIGAILFHETISIRQWVGIVFGLCACVLLG
jgi:drug/metabolite transporter (DMT)-like permease